MKKQARQRLSGGAESLLYLQIYTTKARQGIEYTKTDRQLVFSVSSHFVFYPSMTDHNELFCPLQ